MIKDRAAAALIFFTRLPIWKWTSPPKEAYTDVVALWPLTGWLTGSLAALVMWAAGSVAPWPMAVIVAITARLLLTGALHEDGLADFCDAFGGGADRSRILTIMKDSHIGTYGVLGLILYLMLMAATLISLPPIGAMAAMAAADPFSKMCASRLTQALPYARPEGPKNGITYSKMPPGMKALCLAAGIIPVIVACYVTGSCLTALSCLGPIAVTARIIKLLRRKIDGYTGDCCGAAALLSELAFLLLFTITFHHLQLQ
ncbi:MAG: adenosylcobinamide-GDP ribazoletransferase [Pseudoflavonifractor sp.]|nr:adenosylcobinamide-GDP ribazoletransferase [Alloprevotella sp.]MCM1117440.1 adenosylcobinamide-GDP ribazoletransferase [Pseudoflavonifractor sp.]